MVDGGHLDGPGQPGERAADEEGQQPVLPGGHAEQEGGPVAGPGRLELEPEVRPLQQDVDHDDRQDAQAQRPGAQAQSGDGGQGQLVGEGLGAAHRADARALPGPEDEPERQGGGHVVEAQPAEDLVDSAEGLEDPGQGGPQGAPDHAGEDGQDDDERGGEAGVLQQAEHPGGEHRAEHDLPLHADVPQAGGERHQHARRGQQQRHPGHEHVGEAGDRADGAQDDLLVGRERGSPGGQEDDGGERPRPAPERPPGARC